MDTQAFLTMVRQADWQGILTQLDGADATAIGEGTNGDTFAAVRFGATILVVRTQVCPVHGPEPMMWFEYSPEGDNARWDIIVREGSEQGVQWSTLTPDVPDLPSQLPQDDNGVLALLRQYGIAVEPPPGLGFSV